MSKHLSLYSLQRVSLKYLSQAGIYIVKKELREACNLLMKTCSYSLEGGEMFLSRKTDSRR